MAETLVLPSEIPWHGLKGKDLEELLYWVFVSMGAKDLEWRVGGKGSGAPDQGRDLELSFYLSSPDGNLVKQRWWIEAKGRASTVEPLEVEKAVINAAGKAEVDIVVVATNSVFSNPTRDWVREWQRDHARPIVKLWEKTMLENLCSQHPVAIIRLFAGALTPQGRLEVAKTKLWNYATFTDEPALIKLWKAREELRISSRALIALVSSEIANGDITARSWATFVSQDTVVSSLGDGLLNFLYLAFRANDSGIRQAPYIGALAYLVLVCCDRLGAEETTGLLTNVWESVEGREYPDQVRKTILEPVLELLQDQVRDVCTSDCSRVSTDRVVLNEEEAARYWERLVPSEAKGRWESILVKIEKPDAPCRVGFPVGPKCGCPLYRYEKPSEHILEMLKTVKAVADFRRAR